MSVKSLKDLLKPKQLVHEVAEGVSILVKELSLKERIEWRKASIDESGEIKDGWVQDLLFRAVLDLDGQPVWESADEVDGAEELIRKILDVVQDVNGLKAVALDEAEKN